NDELAARQQDPLLERLAVVRLAHADDLHLTFVSVPVLGRELFADADRAVLRTVLGEDDLVRPTERREALSQIDDGSVEDRLLVVDRNDDRNARDVGHGHWRVGPPKRGTDRGTGAGKAATKTASRGAPFSTGEVAPPSRL